MTAGQSDLKYVRAAELVRARIADGTLRPGESAPSGAALARMTGYSSLTCRRALRELVRDGTLALGPSANARPRVPGPGASGARQALEEAVRALSAGLASRRRALGLTQPELAYLVGYSATTVGHAETGRLWQGRDFWENADKVLAADGELVYLHDVWRASAVPGADDAVAGRAEITGTRPLPDADSQDPANLLTASERKAVRLAGLLYTLIAEHVVTDDLTRDDDLTELRAAVHLIQRTVLAQPPHAPTPRNSGSSAR